MPKLFFPFSENMSFDQFSKTLKRQITIKKAKSLDSAKDAIIGAKYLGVFSSRSLKMGEKYISYAE